jgi:hypothetical protein
MEQVRRADRVFGAHRGIGRHDMALTAVHFLLRAHEAKIAAKMSPDKTLSDLFLEVAQSYEALAENEEWLEGKRSPVSGAQVPARPTDGVPR